MASPLAFNSIPIFGLTCLRQSSGPSLSYRAQRETLPGVDGFRVYALGKETRKWTVRGRLIATSMPLLQQAIAIGASYINGRLYTFTDNAGIQWRYCLLNSYEPIGSYEAITLGGGTKAFSIEVQANIEQASP